jgi:1,4-dihydroxy-2-naphthoyl-CoA hydrolase
MIFTYLRTVRFQDTDAAGVVYFSNVLAICHEAYEASLVAAEFNLKDFFRNPDVALPIVHASVDFFRPMFCGDRLRVELTPHQLNENTFEIVYEIFPDPKLTHHCLAKALTRHVCINPSDRRRQTLSPQMMQWLAQGADLRDADP